MLGLKQNLGPLKRGNGKRNNKSRTRTHDCNVIDLSGAPYMSFGHGIKNNNPKKCIVCRKPIKDGEDWIKYTSEEDPEYGRYSIVVHSRCS